MLIYQMIKEANENKRPKGENYGIEIGMKIKKQNPMNPGIEWWLVLQKSPAHISRHRYFK